MADTRLQQLAKTDRNPVEEGEYQRLLKEQGSSFGGGGDLASLARQQFQLQQEANQPAISSLQASIPEISQKYATQRTSLEAEKDPLKARYDRLLKDITSRTEIASAREFGRRGIPLSSGIYETALAERINPEVERIGLERESGLRDLTNLIASLTGQETESMRAIRNAIAQLQSGGASSGIQNALQMYLAQQQAQQQQAQMSLQERLAQQQADLQRELAVKTPEQYATLGEGSTLFDLKTGQPLYTAPKTYKPETGDNGDLLSIINYLKGITGGQTGTPTPPKPSSWQSESKPMSITRPNYYG